MSLAPFGVATREALVKRFKEHHPAHYISGGLCNVRAFLEAGCDKASVQCECGKKLTWTAQELEDNGAEDAVPEQSSYRALIAV